VGIRKRCVFFLIIAGIFAGCGEDDVKRKYDPPVITFPEQDHTYYLNGVFEVRWTVPDSTQTVQVQMISTEDPSTIFRENDFVDLIDDYTYKFSNTTSFSATIVGEFENNIYYAMRLRYVAKDGSSDWSQIVRFVFSPVDNL
jgi:hypothetical protein